MYYDAQDATSISEGTEIRDQLKRMLELTFGKDGYDEYEQAVMVELGFEVDEKGALVDLKNFYDKIVATYGGDSGNIGLDRTWFENNLTFEQGEKVANLYGEGWVNPNRSNQKNQELITNMLNADRDIGGIEDATKFTIEMSDVSKDFEDRLEEFYENVN